MPIWAGVGCYFLLIPFLKKKIRHFVFGLCNGFFLGCVCVIFFVALGWVSLSIAEGFVELLARALHTRTQHNLSPFFAPLEIITMAREAWQRLSWCGFLGGAGGDILCAVEDYIGIHSRVKKKRNKKRSRGRRSGRAFTYHDFLIKFNQDDEVVCCWSSSR